MNKITLKAQKRDTLGRKVKNLRKKGILPANIYGIGDSESIQLDSRDFKDAFAKAGETSLIDIKVSGKSHPVLIADVQYHPVTDEPLHADFREVDITQKTTATVPIELVGEAPIEDSGEGVVTLQLQEIDVIALPTDFPEKFEVDISGLETLQDQITLGELDYNRDKIEIDADDDRVLVTVSEPREEEPEPVVEEEGVVELGEMEEGEEGEVVDEEGQEAEGEEGEDETKEE